jgi:hypothetical protein
MDPVFFVMAILGCGDAGTACSQQRVEPVRFESVSACQAAIPDALRRNTDISYPVIAASCQQQGGARLADSSASDQPTDS